MSKLYNGRVKKAGGGGLYANIKAKKDRIAAGSGEKMRKDYRQNKMGGGMMRSTYSAGTVKPKNKKLAAMYGDKNKITKGDIITAAKKNKGTA